jgi:hypothetical protein
MKRSIFKNYNFFFQKKDLQFGLDVGFGVRM